MIEKSVEPTLPIPDRDFAGVLSSMEFEDAGILKEITLGLDIEHTYVGDLQIDLVAPSGQSVVIHDNAGGNRNDIRRTYDVVSTPALQAMIGQPIAGDWTLRVRDTALFDTGTLKKWSLALSV